MTGFEYAESVINNNTGEGYLTPDKLPLVKRIKSKQYLETRAGGLRYLYYNLTALLTDGREVNISEVGPYKYMYWNKEEEAKCRSGAKKDRDEQLVMFNKYIEQKRSIPCPTATTSSSPTASAV